MTAVVVLAILLVAALVLAVAVYWVLRRRRAAGSRTAGKKPLLPTSAGREMAKSLRSMREVAAGGAGFFARLFRMRPDRFEDGRRVLVLGEPEAGKKTLIHDTGLLDGTAAHNGTIAGRFAWTGLLADGLVVVPKGALLVGSSDKPADTGSYREVLSALRRDRPTRPIDSIVVVVPAPELFPAPEEEAETRRQARIDKAKQLRAALETAQSSLGVNAPVYLIVSKCDQVPGFEPFVAEATSVHPGKADLLQSMLGWSSPASNDEVAATAERTSEEILASIDRDLADVQRRRLMNKAKIGSGEGLFGFPRALLELKQALSDYLQTMLASSVVAEPPVLRGVYLTGDGRGAAPSARPAAKPAPLAAPREILFARDVFRRKIFLEYGLCQLTEAAQRRRDWQYWALIAAAVLPFVVLWGAVVLTTDRRVERLEDTKMLLDRAHAQLEPKGSPRRDDCEPTPADPSASALQDPAVRVLGAFQNAELEPLTTWLLPTSKIPTSSLGNTDARVEQAVFQVYRAVILPGFKRWLACRGKAILREIPEPPPHDLRRPFSAAPEVADLRAWTGDLATLEMRNEDFDDLVRVDSIRDGSGGRDWARSWALLEEQGRLAKYLFDFDLAPDDLADISDYLEAMARAKEVGSGVPRRDDGAEMSTRAAARERASVGLLYRRMFDENEALAAVQEVVRHLTALETGKGEPSEELRALRDALVQAERVLAAPGLAWLSARDFESISEISPSFALMRVSGALGEPAAAADVAEGRRRFDDLKAKLLGASTRTTGPVLARDERGNLQLALSPFLAALRKLLDQGFMTTEGEGTLPASLDTDRIVWNTGALEETAALVKEYDAFAASETFASFPADIRREMGKLARQGLETSLLSGVKRAAEPGPTGDPESRASLAEDVKNLTAAGPPLRQIIAALEKIDKKTSRDRVRAIARGQSARILETARRVLDSDSAYLPRGGSFAFWNGDGKPVYRAFSVKEGDDGALGDYADAQREHVATFQSEISAPVIAFAESPEVGGDDKSVAGLSYFEATRKAFDDAEAKKAGNAVDELHGLISGTFPKVTLATCLEVLNNVHPVRGRGFFQGRFHRVHGGLRQRCEDLTNDELSADYGKLRRQFDRIAAGRFPFASAFTREEAAADAVKGLLALAADVRAKYGASLAERGDAGDVIAFLDAMERVRAFLGPMWEKVERAEDGFLDVEVGFRTNREQEIAGNRIAEWTLELAADKLVSGGERTVARWHAGDPVKLRLRWAKTSPDVPVTEQPPFFRVSDRTAILEPPGQWGLLRLLAGYEAKAGDLPGGLGTPHTLKFELRTQADPSAGWVDPAGAPEAGVRVFMKLSVWAGAKEKLLRYPTFPTSVPLLPVEKR